MEAELVKTFRFEAAHCLPRVGAGHKCSRMHGHNYRVDICVLGPVGENSGWVMDFSQIAEVVSPVIEKLDHRILNEIDGLSNPTSEHLARYIWERVFPSLGLLSAVEIRETDGSRCIYRGR